MKMLGSLKQLFPAAPRNAVATLPDGNRRYVRRATGRTFVDGRRATAARQLIANLPKPGESLHIILSGACDGWSLIPAIAELAAPGRLERLSVCTLGFNRPTLESLLAMLDAGRIGRCDYFLASHFFKAHSMKDRDGDRGLWDDARTELTRRGATVIAGRTHAKVQLLEMSDGNAIVIEGSANLRSCKNVEQSTVTNDRGLLEFHQGWIRDFAKECRP